jgi:hypothetical protein
MITGKPKVTLDGDSVVVHIPMRFKRRGGRKEIIAPEGLESALPDRGPAQPALVQALARAHRWREMLDTGKVASQAALARRFGVDRAYVSRILRLTFLAPDIIEAILAGREPSGLSLARLTAKMPMVWEEQREPLGFARQGRLAREQIHDPV